MTQPFDIQQSSDFEQVYNLDDPSPYYGHLSRSDYQMPARLADWIRRNREPINTDGAAPLRVLDLACGFGFVGALLKHDLSLSQVYGRYAARPWSVGDGRSNWSSDAAFFEAARRSDAADVHITGIDIAPVAVAYSVAVGLIDQGFSDDLVKGSPSPALANCLQGVDLVVESGAIGSIYVDCFGAILDVVEAGGSPEARPSFVYCPRPNVDRRAIDALWEQRGYRSEVCSPVLRYRRPIGDFETDQLLGQTAEAGNDPQTAMIDGYLAVEMRLARPLPATDEIPVLEVVK